MLNIYCGRENVNRDRFIFDMIKGETLLIVPDQYKLQAERDALFYLDKKGTLEIEVQSFSRLGHAILQEAGLAGDNMIDKEGRHMLLSKIMRDLGDELVLYRDYSTKSSFIDMVNDFISQLKQYEVTPEALLLVTESMSDSKKNLKQKLQEIYKIYAKYEEYIGDKFVDTEDLIDLYCAKIAQYGPLKRQNVIVYGFDYLTPKNLVFLKSILKATKELNVFLTFSRGGRDQEIFELGKLMIDKLKDMAGEAGAQCRIQEIPSSYALENEKAPSLLYLEKELFSVPVKPYEGEAKEVEFVRAANYYSEAETAAKKVQELVRDRGYRYRDIVLICNDLATRGNIYRRVFGKYGIDIFVDEKNNILHSPGIVYIMSLLRVIAGGYKRADVMALLKTGFTDMNADEVEIFENYCDQYLIDKSRFKKPFTKGKTGREALPAEEFEMIEAAREREIGNILSLGEELKKEKTVRGKAEALCGFLTEKAKLHDKLQELLDLQCEEGYLELAQETAQVFNSAMELLNQMVNILGDLKVSLEEFGELFISGVESLEVGIIPPAADGITMGTMQRTRCGAVKAVFVLGANEGILPAAQEGGEILTDDEKKFLESQEIQLCRMESLRLMEENLAIYRNITEAREYLFVSYAASDMEGKKIIVSPIYERLREVFPEVEEQKDIENRGDFMSLVGGVNSTADYLSRYLKESEKLGTNIEASAAESYLWLRDNAPEKADLIERAVGFRNLARELGGDTAMALYNSPDDRLTVSPSRLEKYSKCPFAHFVAYGLKPEEPKEYRVKAFDLGDIYHSTLEKLARGLTVEGMPINDENSPWMTTTEAECDAKIDALMEAEFDNYREGLLKSGSAEAFRAEKMKELCKVSARMMVRQVQLGAIESMGFEEKFGRGRELPPIEVGDKVRIEGTIDRVDNLAGNMVKIVDYKSGQDKYSVDEAMSGWKLQLFVYLTAAAGNGREPVGAFYFHVKDPVTDINKEKGAKSAETIKDLVARKISSEFRMEGLLLNREDVLEGLVTGEQGGDLKDITTLKTKKVDNESVLTSSGTLSFLEEEEFHQLIADVNAKVRQSADDLSNGVIDIKPLRKKKGDDKSSACKYCDYKGICKFDVLFPDCKYTDIN